LKPTIILPSNQFPKEKSVFVAWRPYCEEIRFYIDCGPLVLTLSLRSKSLSPAGMITELPLEQEHQKALNRQEWQQLLRPGKSSLLRFPDGQLRKARVHSIRELGATQVELVWEFFSGPERAPRSAPQPVLRNGAGILSGQKFCKRFSEDEA
jgi:hypothetical protein